MFRTKVEKNNLTPDLPVFLQQLPHCVRLLISPIKCHTVRCAWMKKIQCPQNKNWRLVVDADLPGATVANPSIGEKVQLAIITPRSIGRLSTNLISQ